MRKLTPSLVLCALSIPASGAVINLTPGTYGSPVQNVNDWTLDAGLVLGGLPASPNRVIFEAGGDGTGSALVLIGNELIYYLDQGDYLVSTPAPDETAALDISAFSGSLISIRLDVDLSTASDSVTISATDGSSTLSTTLILPDINNAAGGNATGFGRVNSDLAGLDESVEAGFPDMAQFMDPSYLGGANSLTADDLVGTLYTTTANQAPASIPAPGSWGLVPEPSSTFLLGTGLLLGALRRRR